MKKIVVPVDFSKSMESVIEAAVCFAHAFQAHIYLIHVAAPEPEFIGYTPGPSSVRDAVAKQFHKEHRQLQALDERLEKEGLKVTSLLLQGYVVEKILKECKRLKADLMIMGAHSGGRLHRLLVGSVTEGVLRKAPCPVLIVPHAKK